MHCIIVYSTLTIVHVYVRSIVFFFSLISFHSLLTVCIFFSLMFLVSCTKKIYIGRSIWAISLFASYTGIYRSLPGLTPFFLSLSDISVSFRLTDTNTLYFGHTHTLADTVTLVSGCRIFVAEEGCWDRVAVRKKRGNRRAV